MEGYQVSNQCMALVRDGCLVPTKDAPELGYVIESTDKQYVPDVFYKVSTSVSFSLHLHFFELFRTTPKNMAPNVFTYMHLLIFIGSYVILSYSRYIGKGVHTNYYTGMRGKQFITHNQSIKSTFKFG